MMAACILVAFGTVFVSPCAVDGLKQTQQNPALCEIYVRDRPEPFARVYKPCSDVHARLYRGD